MLKRPEESPFNGARARSAESLVLPKVTKGTAWLDIEALVFITMYVRRRYAYAARHMVASSYSRFSAGFYYTARVFDF